MNIDSVIIIFIQVDQVNKIMISQVGRLFVAELLVTSLNMSKDTVFVTSDIDIWPLKGDSLYTLSEQEGGEHKMEKMTIEADHSSSDGGSSGGGGMVLTNAFCCSRFISKLSRRSILMQPMAWISMSEATWVEVASIHTDGKIEGSFVEKILDIFSKRFGAEIARKSVTKGENQAWYMDQTMISEQIDVYNGTIIRRQRDIPKDRLDINHWSLPSSLLPSRLHDAHVPISYLRNWRVGPLLQMLHGSQQGADFRSYYLHYVSLVHSELLLQPATLLPRYH